jgi:hypothetical protein
MAIERYWIAINGPSCSISPVPWRQPATRPVAEQYIGFPTFEEAENAQSICLHGSQTEMRDFFEGLRPAVKTGRVQVIDSPFPQPYTRGTTRWMEAEDAPPW